MDAAYVFRVQFQLDPAGVRIEPDTFETVVRKPAVTPGEEGWLFFRDALWRGEVSDGRYLRQLATDWLGATVVDVSFRELETDEEHREALRETIDGQPELFDGDSAREVLHRHLGSSIRVM